MRLYCMDMILTYDGGGDGSGGYHDDSDDDDRSCNFDDNTNYYN